MIRCPGAYFSQSPYLLTIDHQIPGKMLLIPQLKKGQV
ncbi:hypothetical protein ZPR_4411 [Zunongwangia profunda SM-A87]|uniref:Uncharacterized protein n=1 Tax=Zunongwangia profunda (strain DSM 18752 / CCTCC AB 206139 / SM-A87) TaxID=655815 RepID=D5BC87_ZUNPS|nr:hypothetical protein ZPR_4411 [Zunongwangia profunda SM-A87]